MAERDLYLLLESDCQIYELTLAQYRRLLLDAPYAAIPRFALRRLRFAHLQGMAEQGPFRINCARYRYWQFKVNGEVDLDAFFGPIFSEYERARQAARAPTQPPSNIVAAAHRFAANAAVWRPTHADINRFEAIAKRWVNAASLTHLLEATVFVPTPGARNP